MDFLIGSTLKWVLLGISIAVPTSTSFWTASKLQSRTSNTEDGVTRMEELSQRLTKLKGDLEDLKTKPTKLESTISSSETKYTGITAELKTSINTQFSDGKTKIEKFVDDFIEKKKSEMIYEGSKAAK